MRQHSRKHDLGSLLVLLLFAVFAVCILSVLLTSADTYRRLSGRDQGSYDRRTAAQYITTKVRQADRQGAVSVRSFDGQAALVRTQSMRRASGMGRRFCGMGALYGGRTGREGSD